MKLQSRLKKLEVLASDTKPDEFLVVRQIVALRGGKPYELPLLGWHIGGHDDVMRIDGETDEQLSSRASELAAKHVTANRFATITQIIPTEMIGDNPQIKQMINPQRVMSAQEAYMLMLSVK